MNGFRHSTATCGIHPTVPLRLFLVLAVFLLPVPSSGTTSVDICQEPPNQSQLGIAYYNQEAASFAGDSGQTNLNNVNIDIIFRPNGDWRVAAGHRYTILNVDQLELQTNGHLHTFFFPVHRSRESDERGFRFSMAPAFSASSNVASDLDEYTVDAWQLLASAIWKRRLSDRLGVHYGVCGDHRFGEYQFYPVFKFSWQINTHWAIDFGYPNSQISHRVSESLSSSMRLGPNGNEWYVMDKSLENNSQFVYEAYILEWELRWRAHERVSLTAVVGREFRGRYEMSLLNEDRVRLASDPATRVGVEIAWVF